MYNQLFCVLKMFNSKMIWQVVAGFAATMSLAGAGFGYGWPSPSLAKLEAADSDIEVTSDQGSWIVSVFTIGAAIGALLGALTVDKCGRKWLLLSTIVPHLISAIFIIVSDTVWWLIFARLIAGIGTGMGYAVVPMYAGEIADHRIRGAISGMLDPVVNISVVLIYCVGPWVSRAALGGVGAALPILFGLMFIWMPESPYYLVMKNKPSEAEKSLSWLRGGVDVSAELKMVQESVESEQKNRGALLDLVTIPGNRKALIIILVLKAAQQFSGISAVVAYSSLIFEASGSKLDTSMCVIILGVVQLSAGVLIVFIVDFAGRKPLMLVSTCGSVVCLSALALYFQLQKMGTDLSSFYWLPVTSMVTFVFICTIGLGALPYVVLAEIFPCNVKAWATTCSNVTASLLAVVTTKFYQIVADAFGIHVSFWGFAVISVLSAITIFFILPETKQRSLQEMQDQLHKTTESRMVLNKVECRI